MQCIYILPPSFEPSLKMAISVQSTSRAFVFSLLCGILVKKKCTTIKLSNSARKNIFRRVLLHGTSKARSLQRNSITVRSKYSCKGRKLTGVSRAFDGAGRVELPKWDKLPTAELFSVFAWKWFFRVLATRQGLRCIEYVCISRMSNRRLQATSPTYACFASVECSDGFTWPFRRMSAPVEFASKDCSKQFDLLSLLSLFWKEPPRFLLI